MRYYTLKTRSPLLWGPEKTEGSRGKTPEMLRCVAAYATAFGERILVAMKYGNLAPDARGVTQGKKYGETSALNRAKKARRHERAWSSTRAPKSMGHAIVAINKSGVIILPMSKLLRFRCCVYFENTYYTIYPRGDGCSTAGRGPSIELRRAGVDHWQCKK